MTGEGGWGVCLDAFEEWVRRAQTGLSSRDLLLPDAPPALPDGPVPAAHLLRAQAALHALRSTERAVLDRRAQLAREQAYGAA
jgi:hypothetical protein